MITSSLKQYTITHEYILKRDRDSEKPTVWGIRLQSQDADAVFLGKLSECKQEKGFRENKFIPEKYVAVTNEQLLNIVQYVKDVNYEDEKGEVTFFENLVNDGTEENRKMLKRLFRGLVGDDRTELNEAGTNVATLAEGIKKK